MKFSLASLLLLPAMVSAFAPASQRQTFVSVSSLNGAATFEEDLELTRQVIAKHMDGKGGEDKPAEKKEEPAKKEEE
jgi:hypothetical protein